MGSNLDQVITENIYVESPGVTQAGFSVPAIPTFSATWAERTRTYTTLTGVGADFATTTPEYLMASAIFSQDPAPSSIVICRFAGKPTQVHVIVLVAPLLTTGQKYEVNAFHNGVLQKASYTVQGGDANDDIINGLVTALNALAAPDIGATSAATGSAGSKVCTVTSDAAGNFLALEPINQSTPGAIDVTMTIAETEVEPSPAVATDLNAIILENSTWYGFAPLFKSAAITTALATWMEANGKFMDAGLADSEIATHALAGATDEAAVLKSATRHRTRVFFHPRAYQFADAAELGAMFTVEPGHDDWVLRALSGVTEVNYTATQIQNLKDKHCGFYFNFGGSSVTGGDGKMASGRYADVTRDVDQMAAWYAQDIASLKLQLASLGQKLPFTDEGIAKVENQIRGVNARGETAGIVAPSPAPVVQMPLLSSISAADKAARLLEGIVVSWYLSGGIHKVVMNIYVQQ